jgi:hypothetical protein
VGAGVQIQGVERTVRRVLRLVERTIAADGQHLITARVKVVVA